MPMMARVWRMSGVVAVATVWCFTASPSGAIVVDLDAAAVKQAVEDGKKIKEVKTIPTRFGADLSKDLCGGGGEIQTKTVGLNRLGALIAANPEQAEKDKEQVNAAIKKVAESDRRKIASTWPYGSFDPNAVTKVTLYPPMGDAMSWEVDLSKIR